MGKLSAGLVMLAIVCALSLLAVIIVPHIDAVDENYMRTNMKEFTIIVTVVGSLNLFVMLVLAVMSGSCAYTSNQQQQRAPTYTSA